MKHLPSKPSVFSAFDGISCGRLGFTRAGIAIANYFASELPFIEAPSGKLIPNPVIDIVKFHFPDTIYVGDITKVDGHQYRDHVHIVIGGSPCQSFSGAGERSGFDGKSGLFWHFPRLIDEIDPLYFLLENVVMKDKWIHTISDAMGIEPIFINSKIASGQSRPRVYWTNIPYTPIEDKGIVLGDVVLGAVTGASRHGERNKTGIGVNWPQGDWKYQPENKSYCLTRNTGQYRNTQGKIMRFTPEDCERLQTVPVGYTGVTGLCNSKRIEALGNAWTVDVLVEAFFKNLPWASNMKVGHSTNIFKV